MQGMESMKQATNVTRVLKRRGILENALSKMYGRKEWTKLISLRIFSSAAIL